MKHTIKLVGILIASIALFACGGGGGNPPVKTEKVWRLVEEVVDGGGKRTYEYDGSGYLIKQISSLGDYREFNYDDKGRLISRDDFEKSGKLIFRYELDSHGELKTRLTSDANGILVPDRIYRNTYDENRVVSDDVEKSHSGKHGNTTLIPYPNSKLITRTSENPNWVQQYTYEDNKNKVILKRYDTLTSTVVLAELDREYNKYGDLVRNVLDTDGDGPKPPTIGIRNFTYTPDPTKGGNISERVQTLGNQTYTRTYTWEQMDIPVQ